MGERDQEKEREREIERKIERKIESSSSSSGNSIVVVIVAVQWICLPFSSVAYTCSVYVHKKFCIVIYHMHVFDVIVGKLYPGNRCTSIQHQCTCGLNFFPRNKKTQTKTQAPQKIQIYIYT